MKIETLYRSPETKNDSLIKNNNILITQNYVNRAYYLISFYGHSKVLFPDSKETWERINQKSIFWRQHGVETRRRSRDALSGLVFVETCRTLCWSEFVSFLFGKFAYPVPYVFDILSKWATSMALFIIEFGFWIQIFNNYWLRLSLIWIIMETEEVVARRGR